MVLCCSWGEVRRGSSVVASCDRAGWQFSGVEPASSSLVGTCSAPPHPGPLGWVWSPQQEEELRLEHLSTSLPPCGQLPVYTCL